MPKLHATVSSTRFRENSGTWFTQALIDGLIFIQVHRRLRFVLMTVEEYERLGGTIEQ
jgi:hypothetical protein